LLNGDFRHPVCSFCHNALPGQRQGHTPAVAADREDSGFTRAFLGKRFDHRYARFAHFAPPSFKAARAARIFSSKATAGMSGVNPSSAMMRSPGSMDTSRHLNMWMAAFWRRLSAELATSASSSELLLP